MPTGTMEKMIQKSDSTGIKESQYCIKALALLPTNPSFNTCTTYRVLLGKIPLSSQKVTKFLRIIRSNIILHIESANQTGILIKNWENTQVKKYSLVSLLQKLQYTKVYFLCTFSVYLENMQCLPQILNQESFFFSPHSDTQILLGKYGPNSPFYK